MLDRRVLQLREVLTRERENGGCVAGLEGDEVCGGCLVSVGGSPEVEVGDGAEVDDGLDGLMGRSILSETDGIVGGWGRAIKITEKSGD